MTEFSQFNHQKSYSIGHSYQTGIDYFISKKTTVGVLLKGRTGNWNQNANNTTDISGDNPYEFTSVNAGSDGGVEWNNSSYNLNFKHEFSKKGQELTFDADYSSYETQQDMDYFNHFLDKLGQSAAASNLLQSDNSSDVTIKAVKVDYTQPLPSDARLEIGLKSSMVETDNNILFLQSVEEEWQIDPGRTNEFLFQENIHAAYLNFSKQFKGFNLQLGLRAEYTLSDGHSLTLDQQVKRNYLDWFPSASLSHTLNEHHNLSYTYSRRIDRPTYQDLNPFIYFLDQYTYGKGNPFLQPQYTHSYGISYTFKGKYFFSAGYSNTEDAMTQILEQDDASRTTYQTNANLATFKSYSLNFSAPVVLTEWWSARVNATSFLNHFTSPYMETGRIDNQKATYRIHVSNNFTLPGKIQAEVSGYYQSRLVYGMFEIDPQYVLDAGLSLPILQGKGSLKFNVNDLFNVRRTDVFIQQDNLNLEVRNRYESRRAYLTLSYNFGNAKVKPERRRRTATDRNRTG